MYNVCLTEICTTVWFVLKMLCLVPKSFIKLQTKPKTDCVEAAACLEALKDTKRSLTRINQGFYQFQLKALVIVYIISAAAY